MGRAQSLLMCATSRPPAAGITKEGGEEEGVGAPPPAQDGKRKREEEEAEEGGEEGDDEGEEGGQGADEGEGGEEGAGAAATAEGGKPEAKRKRLEPVTLGYRTFKACSETLSYFKNLLQHAPKAVDMNEVRALAWVPTPCAPACWRIDVCSLLHV